MPLRPQTTAASEKLKLAASAPHPRETMKGSPCASTHFVTVPAVRGAANSFCRSLLRCYSACTASASGQGSSRKEAGYAATWGQRPPLSQACQNGLLQRPTSASWNTSVAACAAGATASATADSAAADARGTCKHKLLAEVQRSSVDQCIKHCMVLVRHARNSTALHNCAVIG